MPSLLRSRHQPRCSIPKKLSAYLSYRTSFLGPGVRVGDEGTLSSSLHWNAHWCARNPSCTHLDRRHSLCRLWRKPKIYLIAIQRTGVPYS
jgi:hypothetical protein